MNSSKKYITPREFQKLIDDRPDSKRESRRRKLRYQAILRLMYNHGLRRRELCGLKWGDLSFDDPEPKIYINRVKSGKSGIHRLIVGEKAILQELFQLSRGKKFIVENPYGGQMVPNSISQFFQTVDSYKILPFKVRPHMLRHGCGYRLINMGASLRIIQDYLGHSSISSTVVYTALDETKFMGLWEYE